jgi:hypothetical protein
VVPLNFSPLCVGDPVEEVSTAFPLLDSAGAKMLKVEEVGSGQLEADGHALAKAVAEYVLTSFRRWDPQISLEPVVQGPIMEMEEATHAGVEDAAKLVVEQFEHQPEDTQGSCFYL